MIFKPLSIYERQTTYSDTAPKFLAHLVIPRFNIRYVKGPWGYYLSQWIETEEYELWLHYIWIEVKGSLFPVSPKTIYTLHHLLKGDISCEINGGLPVLLSEKLAHFIGVPGNTKQEAFFEVGHYQSCHINFTKSFLERYLPSCGNLGSVLQQIIDHPDEAVASSPVHYNSFVQRTWKNIHQDLIRENATTLYLDAKVRDLLRMHCSILQQQSEAGTEVSEEVTPMELKIAQDVKRLIESDITQHIRIKDLAKKISINEMTVKKSFKKVYRTTILQHLIHCRMEYGYKLIIETNEPIQNIARDCGYVNPSHFNVLFKRKYKVEPGKLRNEK